MNWTEQEACAAAERAETLSELLANEGLYKAMQLHWLPAATVARYAERIDAAEADAIWRFGRYWYYERDRSLSEGIPVLDGIEKARGQAILSQLALHKPEWIAQWWRYHHPDMTPEHFGSCRTGDVDLAAILPCPSTEVLRLAFSDLSDEAVAGYLLRNGAVLDAVPANRMAAVLQAALQYDRDKRQALRRTFDDLNPTEQEAVTRQVLGDFDTIIAQTAQKRPVGPVASHR